MAQVKKVILGPGGLMDVAAVMLDDGTVIPATDGVTWTMPSESVQNDPPVNDESKA